MGGFVGDILEPVTKAVSAVSGALFGSPKSQDVTFNAPEPSIPAPAATSRKVDTGASVLLGADNAEDRARGTQSSQRKRKTMSSLGGLSGSGISL